MARTMVVDGVTFIHEEDVVEHLWETRRYGFEMEPQIYEYVMDGDGFAWPTWNAMAEWFRDNRDAFDELCDDLGVARASQDNEDDASAGTTGSVRTGDGTLAFSFTGCKDFIDVMDMHGNHLMYIYKKGVEMQSGYTGSVATVKDRTHGFFGKVFDTSKREWKPATAEASAVAIPDAALGTVRATAMWTPDGVTVSAKGKGVKSAPTLAKAVEGFVDG